MTLFTTTGFIKIKNKNTLKIVDKRKAEFNLPLSINQDFNKLICCRKGARNIGKSLSINNHVGSGDIYKLIVKENMVCMGCGKLFLIERKIKINFEELEHSNLYKKERI